MRTAPYAYIRSLPLILPPIAPGLWLLVAPAPIFLPAIRSFLSFLCLYFIGIVNRIAYSFLYGTTNAHALSVAVFEKRVNHPT